MLASRLFYDYHKELKELDARLLLTYDKENRRKLYERKDYIKNELEKIKIFRGEKKKRKPQTASESNTTKVYHIEESNTRRK